MCSHGVTSRFIKERNRRYRLTVSPNGDSKLQSIVPEKFREAVFKLGHYAALGGHMGTRKTLDRIQAQFF